MLLAMVSPAEADRKTVGWFQCEPSVGPHPNVGALDRLLKAVWNAAVVPPHPGSVPGAVSLVAAATTAVKPLRQFRGPHRRYLCAACGRGPGQPASP